jgi:hypothetical protein
VQDDDAPTMPQLPQYSRSTPSGQEPGGMPTWPAVDRHSLRAPAGGVPAMALATGLAVSLVANGALLVALVSVLVFARAGVFSPHSSSTQHTPAPSATSAAASTTSALSSPTPSGGWLQVAPSSVQLGCDGGQDTQFVVLANTGTEDVGWQVVFSVSADQVGVAVDPMQGDLSAGTSITLQIHNTSQADAQHGVIRFDPDTSAAGAPPTLNYTTSGCS